MKERNGEELAKLTGEEITFPHALVLDQPVGRKSENHLVFLQPTEEFPLLRLKIGARVMHTFNRPPDLANGTLGAVLRFVPPSSPGPYTLVPLVKWDRPCQADFVREVQPTHRHLAFADNCDEPDGSSLLFETNDQPFLDSIVRSTLQRNGENRDLILCLPIVLAFAMTIHKSIGSNLKSFVIVDCGSGLFGPYMLRVAASRVTTSTHLQVRLHRSPRPRQVYSIFRALTHRDAPCAIPLDSPLPIPIQLLIGSQLRRLQGHCRVRAGCQGAPSFGGKGEMHASRSGCTFVASWSIKTCRELSFFKPRTRCCISCSRRGSGGDGCGGEGGCGSEGGCGGDGGPGGPGGGGGGGGEGAGCGFVEP